MQLSQKYIKSRFHYDPLTGSFLWRKNPGMPASWNARFAGKPAGTVKRLKTGYRYLQIRMYQVHFSAHRLIWTYMTGEQPPEQIDHKNRDAMDNRWDNLRNSEGENARNQSMRSNNRSGVTGVSWDTTNRRWICQVSATIDGVRKRCRIGSFKDLEDARHAVEAFRVGKYDPNHGKFRAVYASGAA